MLPLLGRVELSGTPVPGLLAEPGNG